MSGVLEEAGNVLGVAAALVGLGVPLYGGYKYLLSLWSRTYGSRGDLTRRLNRMACGVTLDYVQELLGSPAFRRDLCEGGTGYIELT